MTLDHEEQRFVDAFIAGRGRASGFDKALAKDLLGRDAVLRAIADRLAPPTSEPLMVDQILTFAGQREVLGAMVRGRSDGETSPSIAVRRSAARLLARLRR
jgi:hypothetical protein